MSVLHHFTASQPNLPWTTKQEEKNELTQTLQLCLCSSKDLASLKTASGCSHLACIFSGNICVDGVVENPASLDNKISKRPKMSWAKAFIRIGCEKCQILPTRSEAERTEALRTVRFCWCMRDKILKQACRTLAAACADSCVA